MPAKTTLPHDSQPTRRRLLLAALLIGHLGLGLLGASAGLASDELAPSLLDPQDIELIVASDFERVLEHHQDKVVLVNLWATWCVPCLQELPELDLLQQRYEERGLKVIAVSLDEKDKIDRAREFFNKRAPNLVSYLADHEDSYEFVSHFEDEWLGALPTSFFFARGGELSEVLNGRALYQVFEEGVLKLLEE